MNPQDLHQQLNEQVARLLAFGSLGVLLLRVLIGALPPVLILLAAGCVIWMMGLYLAIRREYLLEHAPHGLMYSVLVWLVLITLYSGGPHSPILYAYPLVPMVSGLILPRKHTIVITLLTAIFIGLLVELEHLGLSFFQLYQQEIFDHSRSLWLITSLVVAALVALYFAQQNRDLADTLRDEARVDFLTRIANRRGLEEELRHQQIAVGKLDSWLSVLMIDIDHFKRFNDHFGHTAGDRCLATLAELLRDWASEANAFVGRYGGEEFMMIIPHADPAEALATAEKIRLSVEQESPHCVPPSNQIRKLTVTLGVSSLSSADLGNDFETLVEAADQALYLGKAQGRNRVVEQAALPARLNKSQAELDLPLPGGGKTA